MTQQHTGTTGAIYEADLFYVAGETFQADYFRDADTGAVTIRTRVQAENGQRAASIVYHADHPDYEAVSAAERDANGEPERADDAGKSADDLLIDVITDMTLHAPAKQPEAAPAPVHEPEGPLPAWAGETVQGNGFRVRYDTFFRRTCVEFDAVPCKQARDLCRDAGFYWAPSKGLWVRGLNARGKRAAEELAPKLSALRLYPRKPAKRARRRCA